MIRTPSPACVVLLVSSAVGVLCGQESAPTKQQSDEKAPAPSARKSPFIPAQAVQRGCNILLTMSAGDSKGEWPYEGVYHAVEGKGGAVIPIGYRVGGTAIVCDALITAPGYAESKARQDAVARGVGFILSACQHPYMQPSTEDKYDVRGWGHIYALHLFVKLAQRDLVPRAHTDDVKKATPWLLAALHTQALPTVGGWNYANRRGAAPFMTGPGLQALFAAAEAGHKVDPDVVTQALDALERARAQSGSIAYSVPPQARADTPEEKLRFMDKLEGSMGRMLVTEATLDLAGRGDQARLQAAVDAFFTHWNELEKRRKQGGTHLQPFGVAPYYFVYAHAYAAQAIERLRDTMARDEARAKLSELFANVEEDDGGWNDRIFERSRAFGTAMVVLALTAPQEPAPAAWPMNDQAKK